MEGENKAAVVLLLRYEKWILISIAKEKGLNIQGTKKDLAKRIAVFEEEESIRIWRAIANGNVRKEEVKRDESKNCT